MELFGEIGANFSLQLSSQTQFARISNKKVIAENQCEKRNRRALGPWVAHLRMTDQWRGTICKILIECIMRNNSMKLF